MGAETVVGVPRDDHKHGVAELCQLFCSSCAQLFIEKAEAEEKWFQRLVALRQERLMGSPVA